MVGLTSMSPGLSIYLNRRTTFRVISGAVWTCLEDPMSTLQLVIPSPKTQIPPKMVWLGTWSIEHPLLEVPNCNIFSPGPRSPCPGCSASSSWLPASDGAAACSRARASAASARAGAGAAAAAAASDASGSALEAKLKNWGSWWEKAMVWGSHNLRTPPYVVIVIISILLYF